MDYLKGALVGVAGVALLSAGMGTWGCTHTYTLEGPPDGGPSDASIETGTGASSGSSSGAMSGASSAGSTQSGMGTSSGSPSGTMSGAPSGGSTGAVAPACPPVTVLTLPSSATTMTPPSTGTQVFQITATSASLGLFVRVHTSPGAPSVAVSSTCDGHSPVVASPPSTLSGSYAHGVLPSAGPWYVVLDWSGVSPLPASYTLDALSFDPGPKCGSAAPWNGSSPLSVTTYASVDTTGGCVPVSGLGQQFFAVQVGANSTLEVSTTSGAAVSTEASATCAQGTCTAAPSSGTLTISNGGDAGGTFVVGVSAPDPMTAGITQLSASVPAGCVTNGQSCGDGGANLCCSGSCLTPSTSNSCGTACGQACPSDPSGHGNAACTGSACVITCTAGYSQCGGAPTSPCSIKLESDSQNCATCGHVCPTGESCSSGVCGCASGTTYCATEQQCINVMGTDSNNCGACGQVCPGGQYCAAGVCQCTTGTKCGNSCVDTMTNTGNCGACANDCSTKPVPPNTMGPISCMMGACVPGPCTPGYAHCSAGAILTTGCETDTKNDSTNCGQCGANCYDYACAAGACSTTQCLQYYCQDAFQPPDPNQQTPCVLGDGNTNSLCWYDGIVNGQPDYCDPSGCPWNGVNAFEMCTGPHYSCQ